MHRVDQLAAFGNAAPPGFGFRISGPTVSNISACCATTSSNGGASDMTPSMRPLCNASWACGPV
ncbi:MAG: hypothetical protein JWR34_3621 [Mycobacterium sp.]|nr:hypothetical protein [Mycobacterium sp.]